MLFPWFRKMQVVWAYRDYRKVPRYHKQVPENFEMIFPRELEVFRTSVLSWKLLSPEFNRVIYLDSCTRKYLEGRDILELFDEIHEVDFEKELDDKYPNLNFFASPKFYALSQFSRPGFLIDTETILLSPVKKWYDFKSYYVQNYEESNPIHPKNWTEEDRIKEFTLKSKCVGSGKFFSSKDMVNAGFSSWMNVEVARKAGKLLLDAANEVCGTAEEFPKKCTFCEESIMVPIIRYLDRDSKIVRQDSWDSKNFCEDTVPIFEFSGPNESSVYNFYRNIVQKRLGFTSTNVPVSDSIV